MRSTLLFVTGGAFVLGLSSVAFAQGDQPFQLSGISPKESNGLVLEKLVVSQGDAPAVVIDGKKWSSYTMTYAGDAALYVRIPARWKRSVKPDEDGDTDAVRVKVRTSTGLEWTDTCEFAMEPGSKDYSDEILYVTIPYGAPAGTTSLRVTIVGPNNEFGTWRLENIPTAKTIFGKNVPNLDTRSLDGVRFQGYAYRSDHSSWGGSIVIGVAPLDNPPAGQNWRLNLEHYILDRDVSGTWGVGGVSEHVTARKPPFGGGNSFFSQYAGDVDRVAIIGTVDKIATATETFSTPTFKVVRGTTDRAKLLGAYHVVVDNELTYKLPSGVVITIPVQNGSTPRDYPLWTGRDAYLIVKMNQPRDGARPAHSKLVEKYGKAVSLDLRADGGSNLGKRPEDMVYVMTFSFGNGSVPSRLSPKFTLTQTVVLETSPLMFVVPVKDSYDSDAKK